LGQSSVLLPVVIRTLDDQCSFQLDALLDSGASGCYIDEGFVRARSLNFSPLARPLPVYNADGTVNEAGPVRKSPLIMGFDWLHKHNPSVDWRTGKISFDRCPPSC
ncbi:hypothetical protein EV401DRAFT_1842093, partial [Pisolithus croceorrhizus]